MTRLNPKKATSSIRQMISECLRGNRYRIHPDGQRYLNQKGIRAKHIIEDLTEDLGQYHLFELPAQPGNKTKQSSIKYQYVITYINPDVTIHIKISPKDTDPPMVYLGFHSHNTGHTPLPQIPLTPDQPET